MKRKSIVFALVLVLAGLGTLVVAQTVQHRMGPGHRGPGGMMQHVTQVFNLTDAQQTQVKAMWESEKQNVLPLVQQLAQAHKEMIAATANGTYDEAKVNAIAEQQSQTITRLLVEKEKLQSKFYQILTPDQRTKFNTLQQRHQDHFDRMIQGLAQ